MRPLASPRALTAMPRPIAAEATAIHTLKVPCHYGLVLEVGSIFSQHFTCIGPSARNSK